MACSWTGNAIVRFPTFSPAAGEGEVELLAGVNSPTSARYGPGNGSAFAATSLFIAEGGGLHKGVKKYRILEWKNAALA